jgi:hypothetical protein
MPYAVAVTRTPTSGTGSPTATVERQRFPAGAIAAYDDEQAARYASTHETGDGKSAADEADAFDTGGENIPNYENGTGSRVQCADGMYSRSGGRPGACSGHGGVG